MPSARISPAGPVGGHVNIPGSKSESNRLLVLNALFPNIEIENLSNSDDTATLQHALANPSGVVDVGHAGTAMRFLAAYFATTPGEQVILTGSARMQQRPIGILVEALKKLGADIDCIDQEGFPPLLIHRKRITGGRITIDANVSSQFITALMLVAPSLENGMQIELRQNIASGPYLDMTLRLLQRVGIAASVRDNLIEIAPARGIRASVTVESDWSSASYLYSIVAMSAVGTTISMSSFHKNSIQGDSVVANIYRTFGVETIFSDAAITIKKICDPAADKFDFDFTSCPDLAQTLAVTCLGLSIRFRFTGLDTLRIKETDRISALCNELTRAGGNARINQNILEFEPDRIIPGVSIKTYGDHRMALAFCALAARMPVIIEDFEVVSKSFPGYASVLAKIGLDVTA